MCRGGGDGTLSGAFPRGGGDAAVFAAAVPNVGGRVDVKVGEPLSVWGMGGGNVFFSLHVFCVSAFFCLFVALSV